MLVSLFIAFFVMLLLSVPIAFAMSGSAILALIVQGEVPLGLVVQRIYAGGDSFPLMAIPFFIIAGEIMTVSKMTDSLVDLCDSLLSHFRSGLAAVTVSACIVFAGISGSGSADAAGIGSVMIPQLKAKGYPKGLAAAIVAAAGALGPIIPPSLLMIIYAAIAEVSVGQLFLAGVIPGLLIGIGIMALIHLGNLRVGWESGSEQKPSIKRVMRAFGKSIVPLGTPLVIFVGIVGGIFTATEAGVVAAVYALAAAVFFSKMPLAKIRKALLRAGLLSSISLLIISMAAVFGWILAREGFPDLLSHTVLGISGPNRLMAAVCVLLMILFLGFFIEVLALLIIFVPILTPLAMELGFDPIHWGVLMVISMNAAWITPPVGSGLFITGSIAECGLGEVGRYALPLAAVHYFVVFAVLFVPQLALWIPRLFFQ